MQSFEYVYFMIRSRSNVYILCLILKGTQIFGSSEISCSRQTAVDLRLRGYRSEGACNGKMKAKAHNKNAFLHTRKYIYIYIFVVYLHPP